MSVLDSHWSSYHWFLEAGIQNACLTRQTFIRRLKQDLEQRSDSSSCPDCPELIDITIVTRVHHQAHVGSLQEWSTVDERRDPFFSFQSRLICRIRAACYWDPSVVKVPLAAGRCLWFTIGSNNKKSQLLIMTSSEEETPMKKSLMMISSFSSLLFPQSEDLFNAHPTRIQQLRFHITRIAIWKQIQM